MIRFFLLACAISWSLLGLRLYADSAWIATCLDYAAKFGPSIAGMACIGWERGREGLRSVAKQLWTRDTDIRWLGFVIAAPILLWLAASTAGFAFAGKAPEVQLAELGSLLWLLPKHVFLGGGMGEEFGWRGYLQPKLETNRSRLRSALIVGLLWGVWHWPVFFIPGDGKSGGIPMLVLFTIFTVVLAILFSWIHHRSGGALLIVIVLHGMLNATENWFERLVPLISDTPQVVILYALTLLALAIIVAASRGLSTKDKAGKPRTDAEAQ